MSQLEKKLLLTEICHLRHNGRVPHSSKQFTMNDSIQDLQEAVNHLKLEDQRSRDVEMATNLLHHYTLLRNHYLAKGMTLREFERRVNRVVTNGNLDDFDLDLPDDDNELIVLTTEQILAFVSAMQFSTLKFGTN